MSGLDGYSVGGTIHVVVNNQIGFTTSPQHAYSTTYPTDVARMLQIPIFHVNGEDPEAVAQAVDLAVDFRQRFHRDVVIDMWCYRKLGHNEGDEPSYTQPVMYRPIASKPSIRGLPRLRRAPTWRREATARSPPRSRGDRRREAPGAGGGAGHRDQAAGAAAAQHLRGRLVAHQGRPGRGGARGAHRGQRRAGREVTRAMTVLPPDFTPHPKLKAFVIEPRAAMGAGEKPIDWGMGEALAFGTLLAQGVRVRLSGQDVAPRHLQPPPRRAGRLHRRRTSTRRSQHLGDEQGTFEIRDSPLSEAGVLGFEYGYSLDMPEGLVIWEAQFGDFVNAAQVIIDQFLSSSEAKWRRVSGLVLLLPHGMEGQGPEHSSARLERFLNLASTTTSRSCNLTTPAQFFHLLRRQVLRPYRKPLIVMSPKSLLR